MTGSKNLPFEEVINSDTGTFKDDIELQEVMTAFKIHPKAPSVFTC